VASDGPDELDGFEACTGPGLSASRRGEFRL